MSVIFVEFPDWERPSWSARGPVDLGIFVVVRGEKCTVFVGGGFWLERVNSQWDGGRRLVVGCFGGDGFGYYMGLYISAT